MKRLAIFASGAGSNAKRLIDYFSGNQTISVALLISNRKEAGALEIARKAGITAINFSKEEFYNSSTVIEKLTSEKIDFIVLAGFLIKVPDNILKAYENKIINIHPALLPDFGGKGMYGLNVHKAVIESGKKESGITIHLVNEHYDEGRILFQAKCSVLENDTPEKLAARVQELEHQHFPEVVEHFISEKL
ncbi:MAG: Phosphoribosylglycinamide formyltransferase [Bacteroidia bacterium]|nr:Phosphoribosylglycinamide formyltransferase [Bacteroidia bacterium]